jgi:hypothetical protein
MMVLEFIVLYPSSKICNYFTWYYFAPSSASAGSGMTNRLRRWLPGRRGGIAKNDFLRFGDPVSNFD